MLKGWGFPLAFETFGYKRERRNVYKSTEASISARGVLGPNVVVGKHTDIGENVVISNSIVGKNCRIASGVRITDAIVWDGVVVGQDSTVEHAVIGYSVTLGERVVVAAGCIVGNQVVVGDGVRLEPNTKLCAQAGDDEDEDDVSLKPLEGEDSQGFYWEYRHHVGEESEDEEEDGQNALGHLACRDFSALTLGDTSDSDMSSESSDDGEEDATLAESAFAKELAQTIERAFAENHTVDVAALELNTLRMAYDADYDTIREAVIKALLDEIKAKNAVKTLLGRWSNLVLRMIHSKKDQLHALAIISDHCSGDAVLRKVYPQVLHQLYDQDVLEEGILLWWHAQPSPSPADQAMKALATPLITWLKEADEDSGSEDE